MYTSLLSKALPLPMFKGLKMEALDDDPIIGEHNVFVSTQLAQYLHIFQLPGNVAEAESHEAASMTYRFKKTSKVVEMELPLDTRHPTYSPERAEELASNTSSGKIKYSGLSGGGEIDGDRGGERLNRMRYAGTPIRIKSDERRYFVVTSVDGALHMTPVETFINMKPSLHYLDEADAKTKSITKRMEAAEGGDAQSKLKAVQVHFRKRETEEQMAARLSSYGYLQRQIDEEPWLTVSHFLPGSAESTTVSDRLFSSTMEPIEFK